MHVESIDSDVYSICDRIKQISPNLHINVFADGEVTKFVITEDCIDGVNRLVKKFDSLDARMITELEKMMALPLQSRLTETERQIEIDERKREEERSEQLWEDMGQQMLHQLHKDGFTDHNPKSFPKSGPKVEARRKKPARK